MPGSRQSDVLVIGAGLAGLVAARELRRAGRDVIVLEARDRVGGRLRNAALPTGTGVTDSPGVAGPPGKVVEMGGQWVGPGQERVLRLIDELGLATFRTYDSGRHIAEIGAGRSEYTGRIPRMNPVVLADIGQAQLRLDRMARGIDLAAPWSDPRAEELDGQTFASWLRSRVHTRSGRAFFRMITESVLAAEPEDMSALWALFYFGSGGGVDSLINTDRGAQQDRIVGGSQRIAVELAAELGDTVLLDAAVQTVTWTSTGITATTVDGRGFAARHAVVALPPPLAGGLTYHPVLPTDRRLLLARLPMGRVIKINVLYPEPFWRAAGYSGQANSDRRSVGTVFDNSPPDGSPGVLVGFIEGRAADVAGRLDPADRQAQVIDDLVGYFGPAARDTVGYLEQDWAAEEYTGGCYGAFAPPMVLTRYGHALRTPVGPLHWAGTETATRYAGYMDGAVESGQRVAAEILVGG